MRKSFEVIDYTLGIHLQNQSRDYPVDRYNKQHHKKALVKHSFELICHTAGFYTKMFKLQPNCAAKEIGSFTLWDFAHRIISQGHVMEPRSILE